MPFFTHGGARVALLFMCITLIVLPAMRVPAPRAYAAPHAGHGTINALLRAEIVRVMSRAHGLRDRQPAPRVPVVVTASRDVSAAIRRHHGRVDADIAGRVIAARIPVGAVSAIAATEGVRTVFPSLKYHLSLDRSVPEIGANRVWSQTDRNGLAVTGQGMLIGFVDSGIDYTNPDFVNPDGTTRIMSIWDQTTSGTSPGGYTFGNECTAASIQSRACTERDTDGHGTHVAGIAAGNGRSGGSPLEIGVAPQARLLVVKSDLTLAHILAAWKYLTDRAAAMGLPIVINNSFGGSISPHDGSSPDSLAIDRLSGPGRVFVAAAGNEGDQGLHTSGTVTSGGQGSLTLTATNRSDELSFGVFHRSGTALNATLSPLGTGDSFHVDDGESVEDRPSADRSISVSMESDSWDSNWSILDVTIKSAHAKLGGRFTLDLQPHPGTGSVRYDAWIEQDGAARFAAPDESTTVDDPADARTAIAVGNYATRSDWVDHDGFTHTICAYAPCVAGRLDPGDIAAYSSVGPASDGRQKPDISAPGTMITSSLSHDAAVCSTAVRTQCLSPIEISQDGLHLIETGTSMASPHVAGTIALMFQVNRSLSAESVATILRATARHDSFTGFGWTPTFGAGKLDAFNAVRLASETPVATSIPTATAAPATPVATSTVDPTPTASATATPPTPTFTILAARIDRKGTPDGWRLMSPSAHSRFKVKAGIDLSVYTRFDNVTSDTAVTVNWTILRGNVSRFRQVRTYTRSPQTANIAWDHVRYIPRHTGTFTFVAGVVMDGVVAARSVTFQAVR